MIFKQNSIALVILALVPLLAVSIFSNVEITEELFSTNITSLVVFGYTVWLLILWMVGSIFWTNYYLDVWIITNKRIIDVEQQGLFKREISFLHMDKIQDVTFKVDGVLATMLNYGNLAVQTAGAEGDFPISGVPNPAVIQDKLSEALELFRETERAKNRV